MVSYSMGEDYWEVFKLQEEDIEFLYNHLLELETPLTSKDLVEALVDERIQRKKIEIESQRTSGGDLYQPKGSYKEGQNLIFPALGWKHGIVTAIREGKNPEINPFKVIDVTFENKDQREFAIELPEHKLNQPPKITDDLNILDRKMVIRIYYDDLAKLVEEELVTNPDFVRIAGNWFPRALLVDINIGHLNLAEAVLDLEGGGPKTTKALLEQIEISADVNPNLIEFSMDLVLQEDPRFDEVGPAGNILWFLKRLEPPEVLETPEFLQYHEIDYDNSLLTQDMCKLERELDDEYTPINTSMKNIENEAEVKISLIFPHWRSGTLPLSPRIRHLFPTAYEAPRIRFILVDGKTGNRFPGWVVREKRYVYGLKDWYDDKGIMPGSIITIKEGEKPGEVIVYTDSKRSSREWMRTVLVGSDGGVVFAMLKQIVQTPFDERMAIAIPDKDALDKVWQKIKKEKPPFERTVVNNVKELAKLNPQSHVHASELYAAINVTRRCPPGPIFSLLASRPWFIHVGDLHYRLSETEYD